MCENPNSKYDLRVARVAAALQVANRSTCHLLDKSNRTQSLLYPLVEVTNEFTQEQQKVWQATKSAIVIMLSSWTGLFCLASDPQGLPSVVAALQLPSVELNV
jgi:hypothetical protein